MNKYIPGTETVQHIHQTHVEWAGLRDYLHSLLAGIHTTSRWLNYEDNNKVVRWYVWLLYDNVCSTDINECLEFDSGGIGLSGSGSGDSQEVCRPDQRCMNTFGSFLCLCLPGFTSVGDACLGKSNIMQVMCKPCYT